MEFIKVKRTSTRIRHGILVPVAYEVKHAARVQLPKQLAPVKGVDLVTDTNM